jgi:hypothetical protein
MMTTNKQWWGEFEFTLDETKCWRIDERLIAIRRTTHEWTIWNKETESELHTPIVINKPEPTESFDNVDYRRYVLGSTSEQIIIEPSLADRAMIARPSKPLVVLPGEEIKVFISTPLWMTILVPQREVPIADIPFWRPSDSWFGPSTITGDLCYSKYTDAKIDEQQLEKTSHRASTEVTLKNDLEEPLHIERINLPMPALKLYINDEGEFWTDRVFILQKLEHSKSVSRIRQLPPDNMATMRQVSESRELSKKTSFSLSIKSLVD